MFVSKDGTVTGSIDVSRLAEVEPKTDEARAQLDALKAEAQAGQEQVARDAERLAEQHEAQQAQLRGDDDEEQSQREQQRDAGRRQAAADENQQAEVKQLQAEAEAAGVTVDKRWGADRLRQEIDASKTASLRKQRG